MPAAAAQADARVNSPASPQPPLFTTSSTIDIGPTMQQQQQQQQRTRGSQSSTSSGRTSATSTRPTSQQSGSRPSTAPPCTHACCSPVAKTAAPTPEPTSLNRPVLKRGADSHTSTTSTSVAHTAHTGQHFYSTGTDGSQLQSEDGSTSGFPDFGDLIDGNTFEQILEMDDDEDEREFSKSIVYDFFTQADSTFEKMDQNLEKRDLAQLSALGHFLKGSSATLGLTKVKDSCEKIQHFGAQKDVTGTRDEPDKDKCLKNCKETIAQAKTEFKEVEVLLKRFYRDDGSGAPA